MNTQVYFHRIRRIYDKYLTEYMTNWEKKLPKAQDILEYDDSDLLVQMKTESKTEGPRSELARRIVQRDHHRMIYETGDSADVLKMKKTKVAFENLKSDFQDVELIIDVGEISIHKQIVPSDDKEDSAWDPLYVADRNGANPKEIGVRK